MAVSLAIVIERTEGRALTAAQIPGAITCSMDLLAYGLNANRLRAFATRPARQASRPTQPSIPHSS